MSASAPQTYLVDTSALVRILRRQVEPHWQDRVAAGHVWLCDPVATETMAIAPAAQYDRFRQRLFETHPWVSVPEDPWPAVRDVQSRLARLGAHQCLSVADHLVVATALRSGLTVLHADDDFVTAARAVPELRQEKLPDPLVSYLDRPTTKA